MHRRDRATSRQILDHSAPVSVRDRVEWGILSTLAHQVRDIRQAHMHLANALTLAQPHRYLATIVRTGTGVTDLLRSMPAPVPLRDYVDALLRVSDSAQLRPSAGAHRAGADSLLTSREMDVLRLLSSRLTSHEIAETLFISMNTLKSHMRSVYLKLHVNSRAEAVSAADARDLLHAGAG